MTKTPEDTLSRSYEESLKAMYGLRRFGIKLELSTIQGILARLGNPQDRYRTIHIAGTNGKGSVAASLSAILLRAGHRAGLFTSPHLSRFNERIRIDEAEIENAAVVSAYEAVREAAEGAERSPTFFEFSCAMAMLAFGRHGVEWAVMETGMGGRMDATNVARPDLCVITNISLEHQMYLGGTLSAIAGEKGGIIKPGVPVITAACQKAALGVIRRIAAEKDAPLFRLSEHFRVRRTGDNRFNYYGMDHVWRDVRPGLPGYYQVENAALTLAACEILIRNGLDLPEAAIREGLASVRWPGRLEVIRQSPMVVLDGAHNLMAARNLGDYLSRDLAGREITLVAGILDDKPYVSMLRSLLPPCRRAIFVRARIDRALPPETLAEAARAEGLVEDIAVIPDVGPAVDRAIAMSAPDGVVCVAGSLYVVGEARQWLTQGPADPFQA